jgi:hypothetical protein
MSIAEVRSPSTATTQSFLLQRASVGPDQVDPTVGAVHLELADDDLATIPGSA